MSKSNYLENELLDHVLRNSSYTPATTVYFALFTSDPAEDGSGNEVAGGSYARQSMSFAAASGGSCVTDAGIDFTDLPAATITHVAIYDASSNGNLLYYGELASQIITNSGDDINFASGDITVSEG